MRRFERTEPALLRVAIVGAMALSFGSASSHRSTGPPSPRSVRSVVPWWR